MKLPKQIIEEGIEEQVASALGSKTVELFKGSDNRIPLITINKNLRRNLFFAKSVNEVVIGFRAIDRTLALELKGLTKVENKSERVSRLLLVTNDGSPRFYRDLESLRKAHGERLLICRLDISSSELSNILGFKQNQAVKAILLNRKKSVVNILKSLV